MLFLLKIQTPNQQYFSHKFIKFAKNKMENKSLKNIEDRKTKFLHLVNSLFNSNLSVYEKQKNANEVLEMYELEVYDKYLKSIYQLEEERYAWSLATFPEASALGSLKKLKEEVDEIEVNIYQGERDVMEYADCLMCLFDSARRQENPITISEIFDAFEKKLEINKKRTWTKNDNGSYSHVK